MAKVLLDGLVAQAVTCALALIAGWLSRGASAAARSHVWRAGLVAFALAPLAPLLGASLGVSRVHVPVPSPLSEPVSRALGQTGFAGAAPGVTRPGEQPGSPAPTASAATAPSASEVGATQFAVRDRPAWALWCWAAGAVLLLGLLVRDGVCIGWLLHHGTPVADPDLRTIVDRWCSQMGLRSPPALATSPNLNVPVAVAWPMPVVLFPERPGLGAPGTEGVTVHELAHIRRRDPLASGLALLIRAVWWWHPMAWLLAKRIRATSEEACDDWAVSLTGQRREYAELLAHYAERVVAASGVAASRRGMALLRRVERIVRARGGAPLTLPWGGRALSSLCVLGVVVAAAAFRVGGVGSDVRSRADAAALWGNEFERHFSRSQAGYVRTFRAPSDRPVLRSVWLHASTYGWTGARDCVLAVTDSDLRALAVYGVPYAALPYGREPEWREIALPDEVRPPEEFAVVLYPHSLVDCGVFVSVGRTSEGEARSWVARVDEAKPRPLEIDGAPAEWAMQCDMTARFDPPAGAPIMLRCDDGVPDGGDSVAGAAQTVRFRTPDDRAHVLSRVLVAGAYYGRAEDDGRENRFAVRLYDPEMEPLGEWFFRYDEFFRAEEPGWASLPLEGPPTVSGEFYIACDMRSREMPGVYVGYDTSGGPPNSFLLSSGGPRPWDREGQAANWCIRCELRKAR